MPQAWVKHRLVDGMVTKSAKIVIVLTVVGGHFGALTAVTQFETFRSHLRFPAGRSGARTFIPIPRWHMLAEVGIIAQENRLGIVPAGLFWT